jgi:hypothetical protein
MACNCCGHEGSGARELCQEIVDEHQLLAVTQLELASALIASALETLVDEDEAVGVVLAITRIQCQLMDAC